MDITNAAIFEVLAQKRGGVPTIQSGAAAAGSRRRPFPWVGGVAPLLSRRSPAAPFALPPALREALGVSVTLVAIVVAALI